MPIPESQLETWTHQGSVAASARTYTAVKNAIDLWPALARRTIDVFLQGSYRNSTNIYGESDVDVVVQCPETFFFDAARLATADEAAIVALPPARYEWDEFRADVHNALTHHFGAQNIENGNKCIRVWGTSESHITADVVPAFTHRLYRTRWTFEGGIAFLTRKERRRVVNFPKQHYNNAVAKQSRTGNVFKPGVRLFKNATARLVEMGRLDEDDAPSYFVECALANVPDEKFFVPTWQSLYCMAFDHLGSADWSALMCLNGLIPLLGTGPDAWAPERVRRWLAELRRLWTES